MKYATSTPNSLRDIYDTTPFSESDVPIVQEIVEVLNKLWLMFLFVLLLSSMACSAIKEKVNRVTAKTVMVANMCDQENIGNIVSVKGVIWGLDNPHAHITSEDIDRNSMASFSLMERLLTREEMLAYKGIVKEHIQLKLGRGNNQVEYIEDLTNSKIRTDSGQVTSYRDRLQFNGKVVYLYGNTDRCYLQDVTIEKP